MVIAFSVAELRHLADSLGVGDSVAWDRGVHQASREVVQQCQRYAGLPALVAKLREVRPLFEWPESVAPSIPSLPPTMQGQRLPDLCIAAALPARITDPFAPAPTTACSPASLPPLSPPPSAAPVLPAPPERRASPHWPAVAAASKGPVRLGDPLIVVGALTLASLAAIAAFVLGRASTSVSGLPEGAPAPLSIAPDRPGPAQLAAVTLVRGFAAVARDCALPPSAGKDALIFARAFDRCGPGSPARNRSTAPPLAIDPSSPIDPPDPVDAPPAPRRREPRHVEPQAPGASASGGGCLAACQTTHRSCKDRCGPEPTDVGAYEGFNRCLARCLSAASHCRLACP